MRPAKYLLAFLSLAPLACAQQAEVRASQLANGMKILVQEDHNIPNVALYLFFKIGSRNERPGVTGISHFFEHMMFNGAKKYGPKQLDIEMERAGGRNNAYTTRDVTVYTDWFPRPALELIFDLEADRIRDLSFDPKMVESERGVIASERRMSVDNNNFGLLREQLDAAVFTAHPYGWPVVGWASDIESWTMDDLKSHFRMGYAPNNCVAVIVGDVTTEGALALAKKYLEPIPRQEPPPPVRTREPEQRGERRVTVHKPAQLPLLMVAYHGPRSADEDSVPLTVLGSILTRGRSSRLYRRLVDRDQLAISVRFTQQPSLDPGQINFVLEPRSGVEPPAVEKALYEEIERVRTSPVAPAELERAVNQIVTAHYQGLKTIAGRANLLGTYEVFQGDYRKLFQAAQQVEKVTAADVERVARKYLGAMNRTVATLVPEKKEAGK